MGANWTLHTISAPITDRDLTIYFVFHEHSKGNQLGKITSERKNLYIALHSINNFTAHA